MGRAPNRHFSLAFVAAIRERHPDCKGCFGGRAARCDLGTVMCTAFEVWPQATGLDAVR